MLRDTGTEARRGGIPSFVPRGSRGRSSRSCAGCRLSARGSRCRALISRGADATNAPGRHRVGTEHEVTGIDHRAGTAVGSVGDVCSMSIPPRGAAHVLESCSRDWTSRRNQAASTTTTRMIPVRNLTRLGRQERRRRRSSATVGAGLLGSTRLWCRWEGREVGAPARRVRAHEARVHGCPRHREACPAEAR